MSRGPFCKPLNGYRFPLSWRGKILDSGRRTRICSRSTVAGSFWVGWRIGPRLLFARIGLSDGPRASLQREHRVEMTDRGSRGKAKTAFPPLPPPVEIAGAISTFPPDGDSPFDPAPAQRREPMSYPLDKQPSRLVTCHPSCRSKVSTITPVAQRIERPRATP